MKRTVLKRIAALLLTLLCLTVCFALPTAAAEEERVYDAVGMLDESEARLLATHMEALSAEYGVEFYMATFLAEDRFDDLYGDHYCAQVKDIRREDSVLLVVTYEMRSRSYYYNVYTYGDATYAINQKEINYILDSYDVYANLKSGYIYTGSVAFFDLSAVAYAGRLGVSWGIIIAVSAIISLIIAVAVRAAVVAAYKKKKATVDYPLDRYAKLELTHEENHFVTEHTTRSYSPRSSGGGGSGSRHGGGSGHRGGR